MTEIVVNHLTRMQAPRICIAGIEVESGSHLRPVTGRDRPLTRELLTENGGPFEVGALVDLGDITAAPNPPEVEDHAFDPDQVRQVRQLDPAEYLETISDASDESLEEAFGEDLQRRGWKYAVDEGSGDRSLACVRARRTPSLEIDPRFGKLELRFNDPEQPTFVKVTDLRFVEPDHKMYRHDLIDDVQGRLLRGVGVYVHFGLARAFTAIGDDQRRHWLQVNGLTLEDGPIDMTR